VNDVNNFNNNWRLAVRIIFLLLAIILIFLFLQKITWIISLVLMAVLIVYSLSPLSNFLTKKGFPHILSVLLVYLLFLFSVILFFYLLIPTVILEMGTLARFLATDYRALFTNAIAQLDTFLNNETLEQTLLQLMQDIPSTLQSTVATLTNISGNIFSRLSETIIILFLVFYLLKDMDSIRQGIIRIFPIKWQKEVNLILEIIDCKVGKYLRGNLLRCFAVGLLVGITLKTLGMPFSFMLGILAGVLNIIAYIGPYLAAIPAVLLALTPNTPHPLLIIALYVLIEAIDAFLLSPFLLGKAVDLTPFSVIMSLLIGGQLFGFLGILLALPVTATLKAILQHYYFREDFKQPADGERGLPALKSKCKSVSLKIFNKIKNKP